MLKVIERIWHAKTKTANRVRKRIEAVLDWATVRGYRTGDNPARWKGHIGEVLPAKVSHSGTQHHAALPYAEIPAFMMALRKREGVAAQALEFLILDRRAIRGALKRDLGRGGTLGLRHLDGTGAPNEGPTRAPRTASAGRKPPPPCSATPRTVTRTCSSDADAALSGVAMPQLLNRMGLNSITVHGFRSKFPAHPGGGAFQHLSDVVEMPARTPSATRSSWTGVAICSPTPANRCKLGGRTAGKRRSRRLTM